MELKNDGHTKEEIREKSYRLFSDLSDECKAEQLDFVFAPYEETSEETLSALNIPESFHITEDEIKIHDYVLRPNPFT